MFKLLILNLREVTQKTVIWKQSYHNKNKSGVQLNQGVHYSAKSCPCRSRQGLVQLSHSRTRPRMRMRRNLIQSWADAPGLVWNKTQSRVPARVAVPGGVSAALGDAGVPGGAQHSHTGTVTRGEDCPGGICRGTGGGWLFCAGKTALQLPQQPEEAQRRGSIKGKGTFLILWRDGILSSWNVGSKTRRRIKRCNSHPLKRHLFTACQVTYVFLKLAVLKGRLHLQICSKLNTWDLHTCICCGAGGHPPEAAAGQRQCCHWARCRDPVLNAWKHAALLSSCLLVTATSSTHQQGRGSLFPTQTTGDCSP